MRKYLIPLVLVFFVACSTQNKNGYKISGEITGKTPSLVYLKTYSEGAEKVIDSCEFVNGKFAFEGNVELPEMYYITIGKNQPIPFFVENSPITIKANIDSLQNVSIEGSETHKKYLAYKDASSVFNIEMMKVYNTIKSTENEEEAAKLSAQLDSLYEAQTEFSKTYVKSNNKTVIAPFIISRSLIHTINLEELEQLTDTLSVDIKESIYTKSLLKRIDLLRTLQPGNPAPEFTQNDVNGNPVSLSDFKGKYVLVDFWASWCGPCRRANPKVLEVYNKFKDKNFTILGVSMDSDKEAWLKAIEDDKLTWTHVSVLKGWKNPVGKQYGVNGIPHAVLINPEGKIVERGVEPDKLEELLNELLK